MEVLTNFEDNFEILALYLDQEDGKHKCWTALDVAGVGKQKIRQVLEEITDQIAKRWRTDSWILKKRMYRLNGNKKKTGTIL